MKRTISALCAVCILFIYGCGGSGSSDDGTPSGERPYVAATLPVVSHIVTPIAGDALDVFTIMSGPASPHGYELKPSDARVVSDSEGLITAASGVDDWVGDIAGVKKFALFEAGDTDHSNWNPHGWTDPIQVQSNLPRLVTFLCDRIPESCPGFESRAAVFSDSLTVLTNSIKQSFASHRNKAFLQTEPFFEAFLSRFSVQNAGVLRAVPGQSPSLASLQKTLDDADIDGIIVQSIHRDRLALELAENRGWAVVYIDPVGLTYSDYATYLRACADSLLTISSRR